MPIYTDAEGNEVELPFTPEEATAAKERIDGLPSDEDREAADKETAELKAKAEKADEAEKRYDEALTKLNKLEKKDFDFNSFRNKTTEKRKILYYQLLIKKNVSGFKLLIVVSQKLKSLKEQCSKSIQTKLLIS